MDTYTYHTYGTALASNWNPHTWEMNADSAAFDYISTPFVDMSILDSEEGVYQWVYKMAISVEDVAADHQDDLDKCAVILPAALTIIRVNLLSIPSKVRALPMMSSLPMALFPVLQDLQIEMDSPYINKQPLLQN